MVPLPGLLAGTPVPGGQGAVGEAVAGVPLFVLPGGVVEPAEFVVEPGVVPDAVVPAVVPGVTHGPVLVVAPGLVLEPMLLGLVVGVVVPGAVLPGVVWVGLVLVLWPGVVVVLWGGVVVVVPGVVLVAPGVV